MSHGVAGESQQGMAVLLLYRWLQHDLIPTCPSVGFHL